MNAMWVKILSGVVLGIAIGFINDRSTYFCLGQLLRQGLDRLRAVVLFLAVGFYLAKYLVLGLSVYGVVALFRVQGGAHSRAEILPFLLALACALLGYQLVRSGLMLLRPQVYLDRRHS